MNPRAIHLKIKIKSLAAEARIIRHEEHKALTNGRKCAREATQLNHDGKDATAFGSYRDEHYSAWRSLRHHRADHLRGISRSNHIAYSFLRGRSYAEVENRCASDNKPDWAAIEKVIKGFGIPDDISRWPAWLEEAKAHLKAQPTELKAVA